MIIPQAYTTDKLLVIWPPLLQLSRYCTSRLNALHTEEGSVADKRKAQVTMLRRSYHPRIGRRCLAQRDGRYKESETRFTQLDRLIDRVALAFT